MSRSSLAWVAALSLVTACVPTRFDVATYAAPGADLATLARVAFAEDEAPEGRLAEEPLDRHAARVALKEGLEGLGLSFEPPPDCLLRFQVGDLQQVEVADAYRPVTGLRVELLDPATGRLLWRGWAAETEDDRMDPHQEIRAAVRLLLGQLRSAMAE